MAERAHPDIAGFEGRWTFRLRRGLIPWLTYTPNPYRSEFFWRYRWVAKHCRGKDVLDVPCGMGWGTSLITGARSVTGVDISAEAIAEAKQRYGHPYRFVTGSMAKLQFSDLSFDVLSCLEGIEHVPKAVGIAFLKEAARVLRPNGRLMLSSPHPQHGTHSGNPYHVYEYPPEEMRELIGGGFDILEESHRRVDNLIVTYFLAAARKS